MGLARNLGKILRESANLILVGLSSAFIKRRAKLILKKQDNSSTTTSSQKNLTQESPGTTIATSSAGTSGKTIMMGTEEIVLNIREWAIGKVQNYNNQGIDRIYDQMALMAEFDEWFDPEEDLDVLCLDEITQEQYDDFVDSNDGVERG